MINSTEFEVWSKRTDFDCQLTQPTLSELWQCYTTSVTFQKLDTIVDKQTGTITKKWAGMSLLSNPKFKSADKKKQMTKTGNERQAEENKVKQKQRTNQKTTMRNTRNTQGWGNRTQEHRSTGNKVRRKAHHVNFLLCSTQKKRSNSLPQKERKIIVTTAWIYWNNGVFFLWRQPPLFIILPLPWTSFLFMPQTHKCTRTYTHTSPMLIFTNTLNLIVSNSSWLPRAVHNINHLTHVQSGHMLPVTCWRCREKIAIKLLLLFFILSHFCFPLQAARAFSLGVC